MLMLQFSSQTDKKKEAASPIQKLDFIDSLRGIAVLLVVLAHTPVPDTVWYLNVVGSYGVQLFFIISAFTLYLSLTSRWTRDPYPILFFFIRRFFRIAPAFYFAALFYLIKNGTQPAPFAPEGIHASQIIATFLFVHGWFPFAINSVVPGGWSIAVEANFYLFVPLCFVLINNVCRAFALAASLAFVAVILNRLAIPPLLAGYTQYPTVMGWFPRLWFPAQACVFPVGFALYFFWDQRNEKMRAEKRTWLLIFWGTVTTIALWKMRLAQEFLPAAFALGVFVYTVAACRPGIIVNSLIRNIGKISFSVYLFHFWMISLIREHLLPSWQNLNPYIASACFYFCAVVSACLIASITYNLLEKPGQWLGFQIIQHIKNRNDRWAKQST